jgi:hypothetical protein
MPPLTRQHFALIAATMQSNMPSVPGEALRQWCSTVKALADTLATTNPAFNRQKFILACGLHLS